MKTKNLTAKEKLENTLSGLAGVGIEITVRGLNQFTFSFEGDENPAAAAKILSFFGANATNTSISYDAECEQTCVYADLHMPA